MYEEFSKKYPLLFRNKSENEPINLFGIECGEGWRDLLDTAFRLLYSRYKTQLRNYEFWKEKITDDPSYQEKRNEQINFNFKLLKEEEEKLPIVEQVKQKFGTLRLYCDNTNDYSNGIIDMAEEMSAFVCEKCGNKGKERGGGWIVTLCENCNFN